MMSCAENLKFGILLQHHLTLYLRRLTIANKFRRGITDQITHLIECRAGIILTPHEVIKAIAIEDVGSLIVMEIPFLIPWDEIAGRTRHDAHHIVGKFRAGEERIAPIEIIFARLRIHEDIGVNDLTRFGAVLSSQQRTAQRIAERPSRIVCHRHTNLALGHEVIVILVAFHLRLRAVGINRLLNNAGCPSTLVCPSHIFLEVEHHALVVPTTHIGRRIDTEVVVLPSLHAIGGGIEIITTRLFGIKNLGISEQPGYYRITNIRSKVHSLFAIAPILQSFIFLLSKAQERAMLWTVHAFDVVRIGEVAHILVGLADAVVLRITAILDVANAPAVLTRNLEG